VLRQRAAPGRTGRRPRHPGGRAVHAARHPGDLRARRDRSSQRPGHADLGDGRLRAVVRGRPAFRRGGGCRRRASARRRARGQCAARRSRRDPGHAGHPRCALACARARLRRRAQCRDRDRLAGPHAQRVPFRAHVRRAGSEFRRRRGRGVGGPCTRCDRRRRVDARNAADGHGAHRRARARHLCRVRAALPQRALRVGGPGDLSAVVQQRSGSPERHRYGPRRRHRRRRAVRVPLPRHRQRSAGRVAGGGGGGGGGVGGGAVPTPPSPGRRSRRWRSRR
jgi:hypothetical protein